MLCNKENMGSKYDSNDYIGKTFGKLEVTDIVYDGGIKWKCKCSCGSGTKNYLPSKVYNGRIQSCGCNSINNKGRKYNSDEYIGKVYCGLEVVGLGEHHGKYDGIIWKCMCNSCGKVVEYPAKHVVAGRYTSCGSTYCRRRLGITKAKYDNPLFIGQDFGYLSVKGIKFGTFHNTGNTGVIWECICNRCGKYCEFPAESIVKKNNTSCGCLTSKHEVLIEQVLIKNNIKYRKQVSFDDLKGIGGGKLRFDFAIIDRDGNKKLVEYDGSQHNIISLTNSGWDIERVLKHDALKNEYCSKHNIELIRINKRFNNIVELEEFMLINKII